MYCNHAKVISDVSEERSNMNHIPIDRSDLRKILCSELCNEACNANISLAS